MDRRSSERRQCTTHFGERGMRCTGCKRVWYSALAALVVERFRCFTCDGPLHRDRRSAGDRRTRVLPATA